jgi:hypothetical protein
LYEKRARDASDFFYPKIATNGAANFEVQIQRKKDCYNQEVINQQEQ